PARPSALRPRGATLPDAVRRGQGRRGPTRPAPPGSRIGPAASAIIPPRSGFARTEDFPPRRPAMPMYEYRCEGCEARFEVMQPLSFGPEDTVCPHCRARKATRLMSMFASKIVGDHKPGFKEMKAYGML